MIYKPSYCKWKDFSIYRQRKFSKYVSTRNELDRYFYYSAMFQAQGDLEEKESVIAHLECKLQLMEERVDAESLPHDEQLQSLVHQVGATHIEHKLIDQHFSFTHTDFEAESSR